MKIARWVGVGALLGGMVLVLPGPAAAELTGDCTASGSFVEGTEADGPFTVDATEIGTTVVVVPRSDTVDWQAAVIGPSGEREISGFVAVDLPWPFGGWTIDSWDGTATATENSGSEEYDLGSLVPAGVEIRVYGEHNDEGASCTGEVFVEIEGGPFDSPLTYAMLVLTALAVVGLLFAMRPRFTRVG
jgi:hypothetical protein